MVEINRWPNALYSALSMPATVTPSLPAVPRSISTKACRPLSCKSLATSASCGRVRRRSSSCTVHEFNSSMLGLDSRNWYCVLAMRSSIVRSCTGCRYSSIPGTDRVASVMRRMTLLMLRDSTSRSALGLRLISIRPALSVVLVPSTPMKLDRLATAGSFKICSAINCCRSPIAPNEVACDASVMPWITPVSCEGKNPLGTTKYSPAVSATVAANTSSVAMLRSSTQFSITPYRRMVPSKNRPVAWYSLPWLASGVCFSSRAHSMGVSVSDTTADIKIATTMVMANS